jgi:hypothetical protein
MALSASELDNLIDETIDATIAKAQPPHTFKLSPNLSSRP